MRITPVSALASMVVALAGLAGVASSVRAEPASATSPGNVAEPAGLWQGSMHGYTPDTLKGAGVLDTEALSKLLSARQPVMIDVAEADRKPPSLAASALWMPSHRSLPGAVWLPGAGSGTGDPAFAAAFQARVEALTGGDRSKPIVTFCHPDCWGSWNAGKRLVALGYTQVSWYPEGMEGWQAVHDTTTTKADPLWHGPDRKDATQ